MSCANRCPKCGRSRGSMTHKTQRLGKSRGAERAKNRARRTTARASCVGWRAWPGGVGGAGMSTDISATVAPGVIVNGDFYNRDGAPGEVATDRKSVV